VAVQYLLFPGPWIIAVSGVVLRYITDREVCEDKRSTREKDEMGQCVWVIH
jgi:hypothetical protein